ncbi:SPSB1, partial [Symbiodinium pilosum]
MLVKDIGFPPEGVAEVSVIVDSRPAFQWKYCKGGLENISDQGDIYTRDCKASETNGVRSAACLPRGVKVHLGFQLIGTHACFGVGTKSVELSADTYCTLYGQDENSWAIAFGTEIGNSLQAWHSGKIVEFYRAGAREHPVPPSDIVLAPFDRTTWFHVSFLLDLDGSFFVWLPGSSDEDAVVVPFQVPKDAEVYVVASTVFGN